MIFFLSITFNQRNFVGEFFFIRYYVFHLVKINHTLTTDVSLHTLLTIVLNNFNEDRFDFLSTYVVSKLV